jgi:type II secretory pathway component PulJ
MKTFKFSISALIIISSLSVLAGPQNTDFNSLIEENSQAQKNLERNLQTQLQTSALEKRKKQDFTDVGQEVVGKSSPENVAVQGNQNGSKHAVNKLLDEKRSLRLDKELKALKADQDRP